MAKGKYIKPAFMFHPIPLVAGAGTGCSYNSSANDSSCTVYDPDLEMTIFNSGNNACDLTPPDEGICYTVPVADYNIYSS